MSKPLLILPLSFLLGLSALADIKPFLTHRDREWQELDMPLVAKRLSRTHSQSGFLSFQAMLEPVADVSELKERRRILELLISNPTLLDQLNDVLLELSGESESILLHFIDEHAQPIFRPHPLLGMTLSWMGQPTSMMQVGLQAYLTVLFAQGLAYEFRQAGNAALDRNAVANWGTRAWLTYNLLGQRIQLLYSAYATLSSAYATLAQIEESDAYVLKAAHALSLAQRAEKLVQKSPGLAKSRIGRAFAQADLEHAFPKITARLHANGSWMRYPAKLYSLDTYDTLRNSPAVLKRALDALAQLDAYLSVAQLYREFKEHDLPMTFATWESSDHIEFQFNALINPLVDHAVPNDIALGKGVSRHGILTGPHGCGKTTVMKSVAVAGFILGQSITVVPAQWASFTPITDIRTYLNVGDDISLGLSSFMAEHQRIDELERFISKLAPQQRALVLVDEPYAKTIQLIGEPRVTAFIERFADAPNASLLIATHFEEPARLESKTGGVVKNFQPQVDEHLQPTYKIVEGPAAWWFADAPRREAFIEALVSRKKPQP